MLSLYNTLSRKKEVFKPLKKEVGFYACGPTVYNFAHIGNLRTYLFEDILKRVLKYNKLKVKHVMNLTDVDDKTIKASQRAGKSLKEFTEIYTAAFIKDLRALNIELPETMTKATEHIDEMVELIKQLLKKKVAYQTDDGSIYFDISKFKDYGKLARLQNQELKKNAAGRLSDDEYQKDQVNDFVLWKAYKEEDGDVFWENDLGKGRPGWHIECSAMSAKYLGDSFDIHAGAEDLIFPHHTNEIAQAEAASGKKFVNYWIHGAFLSMDKEKMAKSEGNILNLKDLKDKDFEPLSYRYLNLTAHYRSILNFSYDSLQSAQNSLNNMRQQVAEYPEGGKEDEAYNKEFLNLINDDLDMPKALALTWQLISSKDIGDEDKKATLLKFDQVFGLKLDQIKKEKVPEVIKELVNRRQEARKQKEWAKADGIRQLAIKKGWQIEDTKTGTEVKKIY